MRLYRFLMLCIACTVLILTGGCVTTTPHDYSAYRAHIPKSVLVLPPLNQSIEVNAPYAYLSTITRPLAECGYYVFPVAVVDALMKENGLPTPAEMHSVSLNKIREVFGADAVLYATIEEYGQKYQVLSSTTIVKARASLVDVATGTTLWEGDGAGRPKLWGLRRWPHWHARDRSGLADCERGYGSGACAHVPGQCPDDL